MTPGWTADLPSSAGTERPLGAETVNATMHPRAAGALKSKRKMAPGQKAGPQQPVGCSGPGAPPWAPTQGHSWSAAFAASLHGSRPCTGSRPALTDPPWPQNAGLWAPSLPGPCPSGDPLAQTLPRLSAGSTGATTPQTSSAFLSHAFGGPQAQTAQLTPWYGPSVTHGTDPCRRRSSPGRSLRL